MLMCCSLFNVQSVRTCIDMCYVAKCRKHSKQILSPVRREWVPYRNREIVTVKNGLLYSMFVYECGFPSS